MLHIVTLALATGLLSIDSAPNAAANAPNVVATGPSAAIPTPSESTADQGTVNAPIDTRALGASVGVDVNSMANQLAPGVQVAMPLSELVAIVVRPMVLGGETSADLDVGGRVEVQFRSAIYMNRVRAYFGVGPQGFYQVRGSEAHQKDFSGGWDTGLEFFLNPRFALHWEMGTSGGGVAGGAGPVFTVGFRSYARSQSSH